MKQSFSANSSPSYFVKWIQSLTFPVFEPWLSNLFDRLALSLHQSRQRQRDNPTPCPSVYHNRELMEQRRQKMAASCHWTQQAPWVALWRHHRKRRSNCQRQYSVLHLFLHCDGLRSKVLVADCRAKRLARTQLGSACKGALRGQLCIRHRPISSATPWILELAYDSSLRTPKPSSHCPNNSLRMIVENQWFINDKLSTLVGWD